MKIPADILQEFTSDVNKALVSTDPALRIRLLVEVHGAMIRERLKIPGNTHEGLAYKAELRRVADEMVAVSALDPPTPKR